MRRAISNGSPAGFSQRLFRPVLGRLARQLLEERQHLAPPQLTPDHGLSRRIDSMDLENALRDSNMKNAFVNIFPANSLGRL
jgi:hypothetical protein